MNIVGKFKDAFFPQRRLDFYALVQARKRRDSPHGQWEGGQDGRPMAEPPTVDGLRWAPKPTLNPAQGPDERLGPFY